MKRVYIACPVRKATKEEIEFLTKYVRDLESQGYDVHFPHDKEDVNQNDPIGITICNTHAEAMLKADEVHVYYNPTSIGTIFDVGMAYIERFNRRKRGEDLVFKLINREVVEELEKDNPGKNFRKVMLALDDLYRK